MSGPAPILHSTKLGPKICAIFCILFLHVIKAHGSIDVEKNTVCPHLLWQRLDQAHMFHLRLFIAIAKCTCFNFKLYLVPIAKIICQNCKMCLSLVAETASSARVSIEAIYRLEWPTGLCPTYLHAAHNSSLLVERPFFLEVV